MEPSQSALLTAPLRGTPNYRTRPRAMRSTSASTALWTMPGRLSSSHSLQQRPQHLAFHILERTARHGAAIAADRAPKDEAAAEGCVLADKVLHRGRGPGRRERPVQEGCRCRGRRAFPPSPSAPAHRRRRARAMSRAPRRQVQVGPAPGRAPVRAAPQRPAGWTSGSAEAASASAAGCGACASSAAGVSSSEMMRRMEARISSIVGSCEVCSDMGLPPSDES